MIKTRSKHRPGTYQISIQNRPKIERTSIKHRSKIDQQSIKNQPKINQNHCWSEKCRALRLGSRLGGVLEASWRSLRGQHSSKLASQIEGKSIKNQCKNRSKIRCLPSSSFDPILIDFWRANGGMLAPKSNQKSMSTSKGRFCKKYSKTNEFSLFFMVLGVEVGIKNRSKIDQKLKPKMNGLLASIFGGC